MTDIATKIMLVFYWEIILNDLESQTAQNPDNWVGEERDGNEK